MQRVLVIFGGQSPEHPVSIVSAAGVLNAMDRTKFEPVPVGIAPDGSWHLMGQHFQGHWDVATLINQRPEGSQEGPTLGETLPEVPVTDTPLVLRSGVDSAAVLMDYNGNRIAEIDVVFPLLHGPFGEDGTIQGLFETLGVPYVGAGVEASAVGMDKYFMKIAFQHAGLKVGNWMTITNRDWANQRAEKLAEAAGLDFPVFVKPAKGGSSLGISRVAEPAGLEAAIEHARGFDTKVLVESGIRGREIECAVLDSPGTASPRASYPGEVVVVDEQDGYQFYDFESKYQSEEAVELSCPAVMPEADREELRAQAIVAFNAIGATGLSRVDFFYTDDGELVINEINTMPGFTPVSMYPQMWERTGIGYQELVESLINLALQN